MESFCVMFCEFEVRWLVIFGCEVNVGVGILGFSYVFGF